jgi:hypothetical protein
MKYFKARHLSDQFLIFVVLLFVAVITAILWFYGERLNILWQQNGNGNIFGNSSTESAPMDANTRFYVQSALRNLYNIEPVTDTAQQRVYFPEARIYVPLSSYSRTIVYHFQDADNGINSPATGAFTSNANTNRLPTSFDDIPCLQRHVTMLIDAKDKGSGDGTFVKDVKLADGRTLSLYKQDSKSCGSEVWGDGAPDKLIQLFEQAKSY